MYASHALSDLPKDDRFYRVSIYHALGETYGRNAFWEQAKASFLEALHVVHQPSSRIRSVHIYGALADLELARDISFAGSYWSRALTAIQERELWGRLPIPVTGWVFIRMGELLYQNATGWPMHGITSTRSGTRRAGWRRAVADRGLFAQCPVEIDGGRCRSGKPLSRSGTPAPERAPFPEWTCRFKRLQLELWLAQHRLRAIAQRVDAMAPASVDSSPDESEIDHLTLARALIVKGQRADRERALNILRHVIDSAVARGRTGVHLEAFAFRRRCSGLTAIEQER